MNELMMSILNCFGIKPVWKRKELTDYLVNALTSDGEKDYCELKNAIGNSINLLIYKQILLINDNKDLSLIVPLSQGGALLNYNELIRNQIYDNFKKKSKWKRKEMIEKIVKTFPLTKAEFADRGSDSKLTKAKSLIGSIIATMLRDKILAVDESKTLTLLVKKQQSVDPDSHIARIFDSKIFQPSDVDRAFIKAINIRGGEFFERLSVKVLEKYYIAHGYTIVSSQVTGGANDNGIDGIIDTIDPLGIKDKTLIQSKARVKAEVTLREVRYFYGSMCAENGTRGIFMTNSFYHHEATKFLKRIDNLVGVDQVMLLTLCKKYEIGFIKTQGGYELDKNFFMD